MTKMKYESIRKPLLSKREKVRHKDEKECKLFALNKVSF